jgi:hypothetical protein
LSAKASNVNVAPVMFARSQAPVETPTRATGEGRGQSQASSMKGPSRLHSAWVAVLAIKVQEVFDAAISSIGEADATALRRR